MGAQGNDLQSPFINWQAKSGDRDAGFKEQKVLIIAQASGTATPKEIVKEVSTTEVESLFGTSSLATMAFNRFREHNPLTDVDILPLPIASGTKASGGISVSGTALESKDIICRVGDDGFKFKVPVVKDDTSTQIAAKIKAGLDAASDIPFTAVIDTNDNSLINIDLKFEGPMGNKLISTQDDRIAGVSITNIKFTGGSGTFDTTDILDQISDRYQTIVFDEAAMYEDIETYLESKFNSTNAVSGGVGIIFKNGTSTSIGSFVDGKNAKTMVVFANVDEMKYNMIPILAASEFAAKRSLRLTDGAVLGDLTLDAEESYGGIDKSSLPYHNTPMSYKPPSSALSQGDMVNLNDKGVSFIVPSNSSSVVGAVVTTYKYDISGQKDGNFKYLNAVDTAMAIQEFLYNSSKIRFGQTRATKGSIVHGTSMTNELSVKGFIIGLYEDMVNKALVQGGREAIQYFTTNLSVELDIETGVYKVYAPTAIVGQLRGLNGVVAIGYNFK